ncbi:MAG: putative multicopper oxidase [Herbinix sp.]|jgi:FtsP/CotA-like multicopper oxidase with cupredoxin domain|nr:putative multicopper oxidase [Herbinix sp.]
MLLYSAINKYYSIKNYLYNNKVYKHYNKAKKIPPEQPTKLDPKDIPKYINQLPKPPVYKPCVTRTRSRYGHCKIKHYYTIDISEFNQQLLPPGLPSTKVWGYGGLIQDEKTGKTMYSRSTPGATFEATRDVPITVRWINRLMGRHLFAVDPTLHWANPNNMPMHNPPKPWPPFPPGFKAAQYPVPIVTHLHGGENEAINDGYPEAWFTFNGKHGPDYKTSKYYYPNQQQSATLWYHDHALGITRLNVYAGLAGFYLIRDKRHSSLDEKLCLPSGKYEIPIVIQDRMFNTDGSFLFTNVGNIPDVHPYWNPEFFGDTIMVNGKVWPNLNVDLHQYRFRVLNGSNARFYNLRLSNGMTFVQIGSDGGFLPKRVELTSLLIAPGERADILVDFSKLTPGTKVILLNNANAPYPMGTPVDDNVGQIMQFTVPEIVPFPVPPKKLPRKLNAIPFLKPDTKRTLTLNEVMTPDGPTMIVLNGQVWMSPISEMPRVGSTEEWIIANLTMDTHPIHLHLVQFQLLNREDFDAAGYMQEWERVNGMVPLMHPTIIVPLDKYLSGKPLMPDDNEKGWKDTVRMNPNQVTRIRVRFAPQDIPSCDVRPGENRFPFDPTTEPGYVWHCHILDHEDNEMMRQLKVKD